METGYNLNSFEEIEYSVNGYAVALKNKENDPSTHYRTPSNGWTPKFGDARSYPTVEEAAAEAERLYTLDTHADGLYSGLPHPEIAAGAHTALYPQREKVLFLVIPILEAKPVCTEEREYHAQEIPGAHEDE